MPRIIWPHSHTLRRSDKQEGSSHRNVGIRFIYNIYIFLTYHPKTKGIEEEEYGGVGTEVNAPPPQPPNKLFIENVPGVLKCKESMTRKQLGGGGGQGSFPYLVIVYLYYIHILYYV